MKTKRSLLLLVGMALAVGYSTAAADTLKCGAYITVPGYEAGAVLLVDGVVWHYPLLEELDAADVGWAEAMCWDPKSGRFSVSRSGVGVMMVKTKTFVESPELMAGHDAKARKAMQELWDEATGGFGGWTEGQ